MFKRLSGIKAGRVSPDLIPVAMVTVGIGEILAIGVLGNILLLALERYKNILFGRCAGNAAAR